MQRYIGKYSEHFYALMRIVTGLMFLMHGSQKLLAWPPGRDTVEILSRSGIAGLIEIVTGTMVLVGLFTSPAAFLASGTMAFAYFLAHYDGSRFWPIQNRGELAALYCFVFLYIASRGAGMLSVDAFRRFGQKSRRR